MELTYRLTRDDHLQFLKLIRQRVTPTGLQGRRKVAILFFVWLGAVLLTLAVLVSGVIDDRTFWVATIAYFGGLWSMYLCALFSQRRYLANLLTDDSTFLSESRVTLDGDGVVSLNATKTTRYSWRAFSEVTEQAGLIVLWRDRGQGLIVPARVLANDDTRRDFVTLVRERIAQAAAA
jgi:YcxB-like protein